MPFQSLLVLTLCATMVSAANAQTVRTVHSTSGGPGPWAAPQPTIQAALAASVPGDEVWVHSGNYTTPTVGYTLPSGVLLRGGFAGTELAATDRDPNLAANISTLSGGGRTILNATSSAPATLVERFTLTGGAASNVMDGGGGAMRLSSFNGTIRDCTFDNNRSTPIVDSQIYWSQIAGNGGAIWMSDSNPTIRDCTFTSNYTASGNTGSCASGTTAGPRSGGSGGAVYMLLSSPVFSDCRFALNLCGNGSFGAGCASAFGTGAGGTGGAGGAVAGAGGSPSFMRCTFDSNQSGVGGPGGTRNGSGAAGGLGGRGGAVSLTGAGVAAFNECIFSNNIAGGTGRNGLGAVTPGRAGAVGGALSIGGLTSAAVSRCTFDANRAGSGSASADQMFSTGYAGGAGGGLALDNTPATIVNSVFTRNTPGGGGNGSTSPTSPGGEAGSGAIAVLSSLGSVRLVNVTASGDLAAPGGGGTPAGASSAASEVFTPVSASAVLTIANSILWNGAAPATPVLAGSTSISYSNVSGGAIGAGNIAVDPLFVSPGSQDFALSSGSPCIDAADNTATGISDPDRASNPRYRGAPGVPDTGVAGGAGGVNIVDMGAHEFQPLVSPCAADFNQSGNLTEQDIFDFLAAYFSNDPGADFNSSGGITVQDIFDFLAAYFAGC